MLSYFCFVKRFIPLLALAFFFFSCSEETKETPPADLIPQEKMVPLLVDVHLLEASISLTQTPDPKRPVFGHYDIFKKHGVTHAQYESSIAWYSSQLDEFDKMYEEVLNELSRRQAREAAGPQPPQNDTSKNDTAKKSSGAVKPTGVFRKPAK